MRWRHLIYLGGGKLVNNTRLDLFQVKKKKKVNDEEWSDD